MGHEIELFTCGCYSCNEAREIVERAKCDECTLTVYDISKGAEDVIAKAKQYGVKGCPSIVVDGKLAFLGVPTVEDVKKELGLYQSN